MWSESEIFWCGFTYSKWDRSEKTLILILSLWQNKCISLVGKNDLSRSYCLRSEFTFIHTTHLSVVLNLKFLISSYVMDIVGFYTDFFQLLSLYCVVLFVCLFFLSLFSQNLIIPKFIPKIESSFTCFREIVFV